MIIRPITSEDPLWQSLIAYGDACSWSAGRYFADYMRSNSLRDWERVFIAYEENEIAGYCTFSRKDCIPNVPYTPYIGYVFVGEAYRGHRLSQKMIDAVISYATNLSFQQVYLVSDHKNLYEKYGFVKVDEKPAPWNPDEMETIFMYEIPPQSPLPQ